MDNRNSESSLNIILPIFVNLQLLLDGKKKCIKGIISD